MSPLCVNRSLFTGKRIGTVDSKRQSPFISEALPPLKACVFSMGSYMRKKPPLDFLKLALILAGIAKDVLDLAKVWLK